MPDELAPSAAPAATLPPAEPSGTSLLDTGGAPAPAAPGSTDWKSGLTLTEEVKGWSGLENVKDPSDAINQLYNAQKLIGVDKIPAPKEDWTPDQWNELYGKLGRPEAPDKYDMPKDLDPEVAKVVTQEELADHFKLFYEAGLTQKQAQALIKGSLERAHGIQQTMSESSAKEAQLAMGQLQQEWGDDFDLKVRYAQSAVNNIATPEMKQVLKETGLHSHPELIRMFSKVGEALQGSPRVPGFSVGAAGGPVEAKARLNELERSPTWVAALNDAGNPAHDSAVKERAELYAKIYDEV